VNIQLYYNSDKADPTRYTKSIEYIYYIKSTIHVSKRFWRSIWILFRYRRLRNSRFILFNFRKNIINILFTTCIKMEESHQFLRLEKTVLEKRVDY